MARPSYSLSFDAFKALSSGGNVIPLYREILADLETPVSAFSKIDHGASAYLLESVEGGEKWARYSFLGSGTPIVIFEQDGGVVVKKAAQRNRLRISQRDNETPLDRVRQVMAAYRPVTVPGLPRFVGGAVGYLSYDIVRTFEELPGRQKEHINLPDFAFLLT